MDFWARRDESMAAIAQFEQLREEKEVTEKGRQNMSGTVEGRRSGSSARWNDFAHMRDSCQCIHCVFFNMLWGFSLSAMTRSA
jgi:hypothetical protein